MTGARIDDPEVIRRFRGQLAAFHQTCVAALAGSGSQLDKVLDWLRGDQHAFWKKQVQKREEAFQEARRLWLVAEAEVANAANSRAAAKQSSTEERIVMLRARRLRDEAEERLALIRQWIVRLERECEPLVSQCRNHDLALREQGAQALHRLDQMAERVEEYLNLPSSAPGAACPP